jgi:hypothetical protein
MRSFGGVRKQLEIEVGSRCPYDGSGELVLAPGKGTDPWDLPGSGSAVKAMRLSSSPLG